MSIRTFAFAAAILSTGCTSGFLDDKVDDTGVDTDSAAETDTDTDTNTDTDTDTDVVDVTPTWNTAAWATDWEDAINCDTAGEITITAETNNWGFASAMWMTQTRFYGTFNAHSEQHTLAETNSIGNNDGNGSTVYARTLTTGATRAGQTADTSTLWKCGTGETPSADPSDSSNFQVTFALAVWGEDDDPSTDAPADCIVFGEDPSELTGTGLTTANRTVPSWYSEAGCTSVN